MNDNHTIAPMLVLAIAVALVLGNPQSCNANLSGQHFISRHTSYFFFVLPCPDLDLDLSSHRGDFAGVCAPGLRLFREDHQDSIAQVHSSADPDSELLCLDSWPPRRTHRLLHHWRRIYDSVVFPCLLEPHDWAV